MPSRLSLALFPLLLFVTPCLSSQCFIGFNRDMYPSCAQLSANVSFHWAVHGDKITWAVDVDGVWDWVGIGISEGGMLGADIAVAWHNISAHEWKATDYWSTDFVTPQVDSQQDVSLLSVSRQLHSNVYGSTLVAMLRPLVTCDPKGQDQPVLNDTRQTVVYAYGRGTFAYHGVDNRGQFDVTFLPNKNAAAVAESVLALQSLELRMPNFTVPPVPTTYQCVNFALPSNTKFHIYSFEPLIDNSALVHHFVLYMCRGDGKPTTPLGQPYDCLGYMECEEFYIGWAPGVGKVEAQPVAALAFGRGTYNLYAALQIHYTNLEGVSDQVDSSGFLISYSSTLKKYDMGVLTLGSHNIAVPASSVSWSTPPDVCPGQCTAALVAGTGAGEVVLVDSFYHMHRIGREMSTRHIRNGTELPPLGSREYFSFEYQSPVNIPPGTRQLLPGDILITTCTYSGLGRTNVTKFGLASYEEMCFNFLTYYPYNPNITSCIGLPHTDFATCTTEDIMDQITSADNIKVAFDDAVKAGRLVTVPQKLTYSPYRPTCTPSAAGPPSRDSSSLYDGHVDEDSTQGQAEEQQHRRERNVGGAVAAILIVTGLGAVAVVAVYRVMKKKRQTEEEQHLFEKYNPNSIMLPVQGSLAGTCTDTKGYSANLVITPSGGAGGSL